MWAPTPGSEESFAALFSAMDSLRDIAVRYEKVASEYHTAYLRDVHANLLRDAIVGCRQVLQSVVKEPQALTLVDSIVERAKNVRPEQMEGIRLDEKRFVLAVLRSILPHNSLDTPLRVLLHRLQKVSLSAAYICRPGEALTEAQGMHEASLCPQELSSILQALVESRPALAAKCVPIFDSFTLSVRQCSISQVAAVGREVGPQCYQMSFDPLISHGIASTAWPDWVMTTPPLLFFPSPFFPIRLCAGDSASEEGAGEVREVRVPACATDSRMSQRHGHYSRPCHCRGRKDRGRESRWELVALYGGRDGRFRAAQPCS